MEIAPEDIVARTLAGLQLGPAPAPSSPTRTCGSEEDLQGLDLQGDVDRRARSVEFGSARDVDAWLLEEGDGVGLTIGPAVLGGRAQPLTGTSAASSSSRPPAEVLLETPREVPAGAFGKERLEQGIKSRTTPSTNHLPSPAAQNSGAKALPASSTTPSMVRSGLQKRKGGRKRKKKKKTAHDTSTTSRSSKLLEEIGHDTFAQEELGLAPADDPDEEENDAEDHEDSLELECGDDGIDEEVAAGGAGGDESRMFLSADTTALVDEDETNGDAEADSCDAEILNRSATAAAPGQKKGRNSKSKSANNAPVVENANKKTKKTSFRLAASRVLQETKNSKNRKRAIETGQAIISSQLAASAGSRPPVVAETHRKPNQQQPPDVHDLIGKNARSSRNESADFEDLTAPPTSTNSLTLPKVDDQHQGRGVILARTAASASSTSSKHASKPRSKRSFVAVSSVDFSAGADQAESTGQQLHREAFTATNTALIDDDLFRLPELPSPKPNGSQHQLRSLQEVDDGEEEGGEGFPAYPPAGEEDQQQLDVHLREESSTRSSRTSKKMKVGIAASANKTGPSGSVAATPSSRRGSQVLLKGGKTRKQPAIGRAAAAATLAMHSIALQEEEPAPVAIGKKKALSVWDSAIVQQPDHPLDGMQVGVPTAPALGLPGGTRYLDAIDKIKATGPSAAAVSPQRKLTSEGVVQDGEGHPYLYNPDHGGGAQRPQTIGATPSAVGRVLAPPVEEMEIGTLLKGGCRRAASPPAHHPHTSFRAAGDEQYAFAHAPAAEQYSFAGITGKKIGRRSTRNNANGKNFSVDAKFANPAPVLMIAGGLASNTLAHHSSRISPSTLFASTEQDKHPPASTSCAVPQNHRTLKLPLPPVADQTPGGMIVSAGGLVQPSPGGSPSPNCSNQYQAQNPPSEQHRRIEIRTAGEVLEFLNSTTKANTTLAATGATSNPQPGLPIRIASCASPPTKVAVAAGVDGVEQQQSREFLSRELYSEASSPSGIWKRSNPPPLPQPGPGASPSTKVAKQGVLFAGATTAPHFFKHPKRGQLTLNSPVGGACSPSHSQIAGAGADFDVVISGTPQSQLAAQRSTRGSYVGGGGNGKRKTNTKTITKTLSSNFFSSFRDASCEELDAPREELDSSQLSDFSLSVRTPNYIERTKVRVEPPPVVQQLQLASDAEQEAAAPGVQQPSERRETATENWLGAPPAAPFLDDPLQKPLGSINGVLLSANENLSSRGGGAGGPARPPPGTSPSTAGGMSSPNRRRRSRRTSGGVAQHLGSQGVALNSYLGVGGAQAQAQQHPLKPYQIEQEDLHLAPAIGPLYEGDRAKPNTPEVDLQNQPSGAMLLNGTLTMMKPPLSRSLDAEEFTFLETNSCVLQEDHFLLCADDDEDDEDLREHEAAIGVNADAPPRGRDSICSCCDVDVVGQEQDQDHDQDDHDDGAVESKAKRNAGGSPFLFLPEIGASDSDVEECVPVLYQLPPRRPQSSRKAAVPPMRSYSLKSLGTMGNDLTPSRPGAAEMGNSGRQTGARGQQEQTAHPSSQLLPLAVAGATPVKHSYGNSTPMPNSSTPLHLRRVLSCEDFNAKPTSSSSSLSARKPGATTAHQLANNAAPQHLPAPASEGGSLSSIPSLSLGLQGTAATVGVRQPRPRANTDTAVLPRLSQTFAAGKKFLSTSKSSFSPTKKNKGAAGTRDVGERGEGGKWAAGTGSSPQRGRSLTKQESTHRFQSSSNFAEEDGEHLLSKYHTFGYYRDMKTNVKIDLPHRGRVAAILYELDQFLLQPITKKYQLRYHIFGEAHCCAKKAGSTAKDPMVVRNESGKILKTVGYRTSILLRVRIHPTKGDPRYEFLGKGTLTAILLHEIAHLRHMNHGREFMLFLKELFLFASQELKVFNRNLLGENEIPSPWEWENDIYHTEGRVPADVLEKKHAEHLAKQAEKERLERLEQQAKTKEMLRDGRINSGSNSNSNSNSNSPSAGGSQTMNNSATPGSRPSSASKSNKSGEAGQQEQETPFAEGGGGGVSHHTSSSTLVDHATKYKSPSQDYKSLLTANSPHRINKNGSSSTSTAEAGGNNGNLSSASTRGTSSSSSSSASSSSSTSPTAPLAPAHGGLIQQQQRSEARASARQAITSSLAKATAKLEAASPPRGSTIMGGTNMSVRGVVVSTSISPPLLRGMGEEEPRERSTRMSTKELSTAMTKGDLKGETHHEVLGEIDYDRNKTLRSVRGAASASASTASTSGGVIPRRPSLKGETFSPRRARAEQEDPTGKAKLTQEILSKPNAADGEADRNRKQDSPEAQVRRISVTSSPSFLSAYERLKALGALKQKGENTNSPAPGDGEMKKKPSPDMKDNKWSQLQLSEFFKK